MLTIRAASRRLCDGLSRRTFLQFAALGGLRAAHATATPAAPSFGRARRCVILFLTGGPPQLDTFDLKPDAPTEIRGELQPIATTVPGVRVSELYPRLARCADRYCVVRSVTHGDRVHTSAGYTMLTGVRHPLADGRSAGEVRPTPNDHPHLGSLLAQARPPRHGVPVFAALPEVIKDAAVNEFPGQGAGFLGKPFDPFRVEGDAAANFRLPEVTLPADVTAARLEARKFLRHRLERQLPALAARATELDGCYRQAFALIDSPSVRRAVELDREPDRLRAAYGQHLFGQGCLLARRLLEAGVALVTVYWHYEGPDDSPVWDTHQNNFPHLRQRLMPPTDRAAAALLADLAERGLLDETLVLMMGEFGRTPLVNKLGGRDHWAGAQSVLVAGAGVPGGRTYGSTDRIGAYPADQPVTPADLTATVLHLLGVPPGREVQDRTGRPLPACTGNPVTGLLG